MKNRGKAGCLEHMGGPRSRAALALAALLSAGALRAATETVGGRTWTYRAAGGAAEVVPAGGGRCAVSPAPSGRLAVPATLGGLPVAGVGASAFRNCAGLEDVALPATVTNIGAEAFLGCAGLTNVLVPARWVRIGVRAFEGCVELAGVENGELIVRGADLLDGTPIFDIKPYLPYVDAYPDARGGFTDTTKEYALQVVCPDALLCKVPENKRAALSGVLKNDPRPAYQHDPERVYTLDFGENKVRFSVDGDVLTVREIL